MLINEKNRTIVSSFIFTIVDFAISISKLTLFIEMIPLIIVMLTRTEGVYNIYKPKFIQEYLK